jgi:hypothetical protein
MEQGHGSGLSVDALRFFRKFVHLLQILDIPSPAVGACEITRRFWKLDRVFSVVR